MSELYAFSNYDLFPFVTGRTIGRFLKRGEYPGVGFAECKNAKGYFVKPILVVPNSTGKEMEQRLNKLEEEYREAMKAVTKTYKDKLKKEFPEIPFKF